MKITLDNPKSAARRLCSWGLKHELKTAVENEPSVFEQLNFYCILNFRMVRKHPYQRII